MCVRNCGVIAHRARALSSVYIDIGQSLDIGYWRLFPGGLIGQVGKLTTFNLSVAESKNE